MGSTTLSVVMLATLCFAVLLIYTKTIGAPAHTDPAIPIPYTSKEGNTMLTATLDAPTSATKETTAIPPIDLAAPKKIETATFAMG